MSDLAEFLLARIAEEERGANSRSVPRDEWTCPCGQVGLIEMGGESTSRDVWRKVTFTHIVGWNPPRFNGYDVVSGGSAQTLTHEFERDEADAVVATFPLAESAWRLLDECDTKKRIVALHADGNADARWDGDYEGLPAYCTTCHDHSRHDAAAWPCETLRLLGQSYRDHPDYREEWRP